MVADVVIMGGGVTGQLAAAYLRQRFPGLTVCIVQRAQTNRPIVGEAFVEPTVEFLIELGLGAYLIEHQYPKYGLTYYHKLDIDNPEDQTYFVDEAPTVPPQLSFLVNRFTFDRELERRNRDSGVLTVTGTILQVHIGAGRELHELIFEDAARSQQTLRCRWVIDATGRNRVLAKKFGLQKKIAEQKDVFWFRLADFDSNFLDRIRAVKKENRSFVPYFATHHFFGKGNWIWCIPMRTPEYQNLISIGITYRKDVYPYPEVRTVEQFVENVGREHRVVADTVKSGRIVDTNVYNAYMWECAQRYSPDRWFIIGDAAETTDPLYSVGLTLASIGIRQVAAILERDLNGMETAEFAADLNTTISMLHRGVTRETARLYECTEDPYQCHFRVHLSVSKTFRLAVPLLMNGYFWDPVGVKLINRFASLEHVERDSRMFHELIAEVAKKPANRKVTNFVKIQSMESMNYPFFEYPSEEGIPKSVSGYLFAMAALRLKLLRKLGWKSLTAFRQQLAMAKDGLRGLYIGLFFRNSKLRASSTVRRVVGYHEPAVASAGERAAVAYANQK